VWFYLTWRDERVRQQIADNAAKLANDTAAYKCEDPCQSNKKAVAGGCCDGEQQLYSGGLESWLVAGVARTHRTPTTHTPHHTLPHLPPFLHADVWSPYIAFSNL
jgi:hypothetical protein